MAGKPKRMSAVKQILRMHLQGKGIKTIARTLSVSKNTVKSYISKASLGTITTEVLLTLEDTALEAIFLSGNPAYKDERYELCLLYTSPSPRDRTRSRMPSSA